MRGSGQKRNQIQSLTKKHINCIIIKNPEEHIQGEIKKQKNKRCKREEKKNRYKGETKELTETKRRRGQASKIGMDKTSDKGKKKTYSFNSGNIAHEPPIFSSHTQ